MLKIILVFFAVLSEGYIIYLQFFYVTYIIRKKNEVRKMTGKVWGCHTKALIGWLYCVLVINALNYFVFNIIEIVLLALNDEVKYNLIRTFTVPFAMFWFDTLNLTNGLCFLKLFESMARRSLKQRSILQEDGGL